MAFTDLMLSYRGPGVIGTVMALFVVAGFSLMFMFAADDGEYAHWSIEKVIAHQAEEIRDREENREQRLKELERARFRVADAKELVRLGRDSRWHLEKVASIGKALETLEAEVAALEGDFEAYKDKYRTYVRGKAVGETMVKLETSSGDVYNNVSIRGVTPVGCEIRHDGGFKRIPFEILPDEMQVRFQFDPDQKEKALASEKAAQAHLEAAVAVTDKIQDQQEEQRRDEEEQARRKNVARAIEQKESRIAELNSDIRELNRAIPDENKKTLSRAGVMRGEISAKRRDIATLRAQIAALKATL